MAKAGFMAGAKYATASAGTLFTAKDKRGERRKEILSARAQELVEELGSLKGSVAVSYTHLTLPTICSV